MALCLQTYCQKCHGYNWKASLAINGSKSPAPAIKKKHRHPDVEGSKGEASIVDGNTITNLSLTSSPPPSLSYSLFSFLALCNSPGSSLPIFLYTIEGEPLICTRAFALVFAAELEQNYLLSSPFPPAVPCVCWNSNSESVNKCLAKLHILKAINHRYPP